MMDSNYKNVLEKLDAFIRKYYYNKLLKGTLFFIAIAVGLVLLLDMLEHFFRFSKGGRQVLFYSGALGLILVFVNYVLQPVLRLLKLGKQIDYNQASSIIGTHFSAVQDKLLNTLQLHEMLNDQKSSELLLASIEQKSEGLAEVPFSKAIDYRKNRRYLKYVLIPVGVSQ